MTSSKNVTNLNLVKNTKKKIFDYFNYRGWEKDLIFKKINKLS